MKAGNWICTLVMAAGIFAGGCEATRPADVAEQDVRAGATNRCALVEVASRQKHTPFGWDTVVGHRIECGYCVAGTPGVFGLGARPHVCLPGCDNSFETCRVCQEHPYTQVVRPKSDS